MSKIVIKKKVNLDFLGDDYKEAFIVFKSIPLKDYDKIMDELPKNDPEIDSLKQKVVDETATKEELKKFNKILDQINLDNKKSIELVNTYLKTYFLSGKFPNHETNELEDLVAEDLDGLDSATSTICFERLTGQVTDPKVQST